MLKLYPLLLLAISSILTASCSTTVSKMNVEKGTFQVIKPPNIHGSERYFDEIYFPISYDANIGKNKTIPLPGLTNKYVCVTDDICLQETPANINYRLVGNTLGIQYHIARKHLLTYGDYYIGGGLGFQNFPYLTLMYGYNGEFTEVGTIAFFGPSIGKMNYEGMAGYYNEDKGIKYHEYIEQNRSDLGVNGPHAGLVAHASFYWEKFALNYTASVSNPMFVNSLYIDYSNYKSDFKIDEDPISGDISFSFPLLLMQDIGISYTPNKIKYRLGVNQITGVKFSGQYWGISVQMTYVGLEPWKK
jgi:hypothetical protein